MNDERKIKFKNAHKHSSNHREEIMESEICGCFHCLSIFPPTEIEEWIDEKKETVTALCPDCGIDSVIGDKSGYPVEKEFLKGMKSLWF